MIARVICVLLLTSRVAAADDLPSGVYEMDFDPSAGRKIERSDGGGGTVGLKDRLSDRLGSGKLVSRSNDNRRFVLTLDGVGPLPKGASGKRLAVVVAGKMLPRLVSDRSRAGRENKPPRHR